MSSVARVTEISAESPTSFDDAVKVGIQRASATLRNLRSAWVKEMEVGIDPSTGEINRYQVNLKVVFVLE
jgi:dodecin